MLTWRARGIELLIISGKRPLTAAERTELVGHCNTAAGR